MKKLFILLSFVITSTMSFAASDMDSFIQKLMSRMTLEEKIGQLNLLPGGDIVTGQVMNSPLARLAADGNLGAVLSVRDPEKIKQLQQIAVKKSRLGIPLLFGYDVIHGFQTVLPIPLAVGIPQPSTEALPLPPARLHRRASTGFTVRWWTLPSIPAGVV